MTLSYDQLCELELLHLAATPTPWVNGERLGSCVAVNEEHADIYWVSEGENCNVACATFQPSDAAFVVAAVNSIDDLLREVRELRAKARRPDCCCTRSNEPGQKGSVYE